MRASTAEDAEARRGKNCPWAVQKAAASARRADRGSMARKRNMPTGGAYRAKGRAEQGDEEGFVLCVSRRSLRLKNRGINRRGRRGAQRNAERATDCVGHERIPSAHKAPRQHRTAMACNPIFVLDGAGVSDLAPREHRSATPRNLILALDGAEVSDLAPRQHRTAMASNLPRDAEARDRSG